MATQRNVMLQICERTCIGGITLHAAVERIVVCAAGVDRVAIIERISACPLLDVFEDEGQKNDGGREVLIGVHAQQLPDCGR